MSKRKKTELERLEILRLSNQESNKITKTCIESALLILMENNDFNSISITDIVKRAGVSRTAYYRNYKSKEDILSCVIQDIIDQFADVLKQHPPEKNTCACWYRLFGMIKQHEKFIKLLLNADLGHILLNDVQERILLDVQEGNIREIYNYIFWIGAIYSLATAWVKNDMPQTVEEMAEISFNIVNSIVDVCTPAEN